MVTSMEKPYVVGMDIGGTNTVFGIVDQRGNVLATDSVKTQSYAKIEDYVEAVSSKLLPLIESVGGVEKIKGMVPAEELKTSLETRKAVKLIVDAAVAVAPKKEEATEE